MRRGAEGARRIAGAVSSRIPLSEAAEMRAKLALRKAAGGGRPGQVLVIYAMLMVVMAMVVVFLVDAIPAFDMLTLFHSHAVGLSDGAVQWVATASAQGDPGGYLIYFAQDPYDPHHGIAYCATPDGPQIRVSDVRDGRVFCYAPRWIRPSLSYATGLPACGGAGEALVVRTEVDWPAYWQRPRLMGVTFTPRPVVVTRVFCVR
jgi:catechol 2,3-dioxygenase-like lactoylglutathione lyase family enzyme